MTAEQLRRAADRIDELAPLAVLLRDSAFLLEHDDDPDRHQSHVALARTILGEDQ